VEGGGESIGACCVLCIENTHKSQASTPTRNGDQSRGAILRRRDDGGEGTGGGAL